MKPDTERRIASLGLNEHEQGLLVQQLKMLRGRTQSLWSYAGESANADLTITLSRSGSPSASARLKPLPDLPPLRLEWPLRLFGLISLLEECETRLANRPASSPGTVSQASLAARLGALEAPAVLVHDGLFIHIDPEQDLLRSNLGDAQRLFAGLAGMPVDIELRSADGIRELPHTFGLKALVWALALREEAGASRDWAHPGATYRIGAWPLFGEWQTTPAMMRLSALYARQFASLAQGAAFASTSLVEVASFLHACECCRLGLDSRFSTSKVAASVRPDEQPQGLLQRLRKRLGLGFKRT